MHYFLYIYNDCFKIRFDSLQHCPRVKSCSDINNEIHCKFQRDRRRLAGASLPACIREGKPARALAAAHTHSHLPGASLPWGNASGAVSLSKGLCRRLTFSWPAQIYDSRASGGLQLHADFAVAELFDPQSFVLSSNADNKVHKTLNNK